MEKEEQQQQKEEKIKNFNDDGEELESQQETYETVPLYARIGIILKICSNLKIGCDLTHLEIPSLFMQPMPTNELFSDCFANHFNLLIKANNTNCPIERMLLVFKYQMTTNYDLDKLTKQPIISVIGETKSCNFHVHDLDNSDIVYTDNYYMVEQQQFDIPNTASCIYNKKLGIKVNFNSSFSGTFQGTYGMLPFRGNYSIQFETFNNETYSIIVPTLYAKFLRGFGEFIGESRITVSNSNLLLICNYLPKPIFGGNYNSIDSNLYDIPQSSHSHSTTATTIIDIPTNELLNEWKLFNIKGQWNGDTQIKNLKTNQTNEFNSKLNITSPTTIIISEPLETDSSIVWKPIIDASNNGRDLVKLKRKLIYHYKNLNWEPKHFKLDNQTGIWNLNRFK